MRKVFLFFFLFFIFKITAVAQNYPDPVRPRISIGAEVSIPSGTFGNQFSTGLGGSGKLDIPLSRKLYATANAGFVSFYTKNRAANNRSYIPLKIGPKYYFSQSFYAEGEVGVSIGVQQGSGSSLLITPGAGYLISVSDRSAIDLGIRFENWSRNGTDLNQIAFRLAYQF